MQRSDNLFVSYRRNCQELATETVKCLDNSTVGKNYIFTNWKVHMKLCLILVTNYAKHNVS
jgi:hypothetical protein